MNIFLILGKLTGPTNTYHKLVTNSIRLFDFVYDSTKQHLTNKTCISVKFISINRKKSKESPCQFLTFNSYSNMCRISNAHVDYHPPRYRQICVEYQMNMLTITHLIIRSSLCTSRSIFFKLYVAFRTVINLLS